MLLLLLSSCLIIPILIGLGKFIENFSGFLFESISGKALSGILGISLIWTVLAFFMPLNIYTEAIIIISGIFSFIRYKLYQEFYQFPKKDLYFMGVVLLIILLASSYYPFILDHFGYYVPTIKWLTEYGLVKGISNLDLTLGQMSVWHIFQAGFSNFSDPFLRINAILLIIYLIYIAEKKSWIQLCFLPILLLFSQSPSPDLPVIVFSLILLNEILSGNKQTSMLFGFSVFVFAIKPTMIWLPVLSFLYAVLVVKTNWKNLIFGAFILILYFFKNIWTFGYPVFPVSLIDIGIGWKPNPEVLNISSQYAILKTYDMQYSYQEIQNFSGWDYIKNWLFLEGIKSKINLLFIISLLLFTLYAIIKKNTTVTLIYFSIIIKSILTLLFSAQYRFFIDVFFVIFFVLFFNYFDKRKSSVVFSVLTLFFIGFLSFPNFTVQYLPSFRLGSFMGKFEKRQIYKPSTYQYHKFDTFRVGNLTFNVSKNYPYNFDIRLPAISPGYIIDDVRSGIFPQLIDENDLRKGFIWKKMTESERKEAEKVINIIENTHQ